MAAPFVTGMAALYKQAYPALSPLPYVPICKNPHWIWAIKGKDSEYGYGLVQPLMIRSSIFFLMYLKTVGMKKK